MSGRRRQFRGQFGINETALTLAIQRGDISAAEEAIRNGDTSLLNDGAYQNTPLRLCLTLGPAPTRHLRLAQILVEAGADPNLRPISAGDLDRFYPSPFQELVVYHELLQAEVAGRGLGVCESLGVFFDCDDDRVAFLTSTVDLTGTPYSQTPASCQDILLQTGKLIQTFLMYGAHPNVTTTFGHKSLFHWVVEHGDVSLATQLLGTLRVDLDRCDAHGNTPLMDAILVISQSECIELYSVMRSTGHRLNLNATNCCGETPLFRAAFVGAAGLAARLVEDGANATAPSTLAQDLQFCPTVCDLNFQVTHVALALVTPLLAPLLADAPPRMRYSHVPERELGAYLARPHKHLIDKIVSAAVSPLLDVGCLTNQASALHLSALLPLTNFQHLVEGELIPRDLQVLMFGQASAGLRQLCVRTIFDRVFPDSRFEDSMRGSRRSHYYCGRDCEGAMNQAAILTAIEALGLPRALAVFFEVEAAKYQVCGVVAGLQTLECDSACSDSEDSIIEETDGEISDDTSDFSEYADSLLFFSSDMLSEESSSEVEDLSDEEEVEEEREGTDDASESQEDEREEQEERSDQRVQMDHSFAKSKDFQVMVETFCEDLAEDALNPPCPEQPSTPDASPDHHIHYQRFTDESTASTISPVSDSPTHSKSSLPSSPPPLPGDSPLPGSSPAIPGDSSCVSGDSPCVLGDSPPSPSKSSPVPGDSPVLVPINAHSPDVPSSFSDPPSPSDPPSDSSGK